jgi:hypothetical protein
VLRTGKDWLWRPRLKLGCTAKGRERQSCPDHTPPSPRKGPLAPTG